MNEPMAKHLSSGEARQERLEKLHAQTSRLSLFEFWGEDPAYRAQAAERLSFRVEAVPYHWKYRDIYPCLLEAAELIPLDMSERRSLILVNPALKPAISTVTTLFAGYRINIPHEIAPAHRHTPNAIRFGLTGDTNFTGVDGEPITFGPGDLVLTPYDTWHNHGNGPDVASVNLSILDMPLVNFLNATYFEHDYKEVEDGVEVSREVQSAKVPEGFSQKIYGTPGMLPRGMSHVRGAGTCSPQFVYRWEHSAALLARLHDDQGCPYEGIVVEYVDPVNGGPIYKTMTFKLQMLRPGEKLLPVRQSASQICTVFKGKGSTQIGAERFDWEQFDTFCIPGGQWYEHCNPGSTEDVVLFLSSDEPTLRSLGFLLKQGRAPSGDLTLLDSFRHVI